MSPFLQASEPLLLTRGTRFASESSLNLTSPPDNTNVEAAPTAGHVGVRLLIQHAVHSNIYTSTLLAAATGAAAVAAAIVLLCIAKNRNRSFLWSYIPIKSRAVVTSKSSQTARVSGPGLYPESNRPSNNYTQNDLAACDPVVAGSSGSSFASTGARNPLPAADLTSLLFSQAQGAGDYTLDQIPISSPTPFSLSGRPKLQLCRQDRPWVPQSKSSQQQQSDQQLLVSHFMPPGHQAASDRSSGMPLRDEFGRPRRQSRGVSITPNPGSDAGSLAAPVHQSDGLLRQQLSPSASAADTASDRASVSLPPQSSSPVSASSVWTDGASSRTMGGGDTSWPEPWVHSSYPREDAENRERGAASHRPTSSMIPPVLTTQTRAPTDSNNPTPRQVPSRPLVAPPLLSLDTSEAPAVFTFEHRRKDYAASIPPQLDSGGSGIDRLALIYQNDLPLRLTTESESPFGSELSSAASGSLSRASSATSPGTISLAFKGSSSLVPGSPGSSQHKTDASTRHPTHTRPAPIPVRRVESNMGSTHESTATTTYDFHDIHQGAPSSFPPSSLLLPPPPPGSDNYGLVLTSPVYQHSHMDGAEDHDDYEMTNDPEDVLQQDDAPVWMRHTRSFGGGICLACLANGGGFYGENVPLEERRPR
ncbi:uncharacterized protein PpBr36_10663 [Pyricularia pennisetigena]|uniref:uncharacterized protein n=1 Tax=Pyricularia pennisetigena TaxID=1578925 RepID=UPI00115321A5|nr:uncharacterized protein PpBr36_10663 [Pyricularia pennisetigena]TLS20845.1 hypothetical protein PpBr36_10663 [Pyricularia pennisetigena]